MKMNTVASIMISLLLATSCATEPVDNFDVDAAREEVKQWVEETDTGDLEKLDGPSKIFTEKPYSDQEAIDRMHLSQEAHEKGEIPTYPEYYSKGDWCIYLDEIGTQVIERFKDGQCLKSEPSAE